MENIETIAVLALAFTVGFTVTWFLVGLLIGGRSK